ncbi:MAG: DUF2807 domain-containing protein [Flavobacteriales bacterium]|nr:DUF2807 domain-containing protein [Flavobacteriales bacterium]
MTQQDRTEKALELLRELPAEVSVEDVGQMVTLFPLIQPTTSWFGHINLNSILMTTAGTMIVAGITYFAASTGAPQPVASVVETPPEVIELPIEQPVEEVTIWPEQVVEAEALPPALQEQPGPLAEPTIPAPAPIPTEVEPAVSAATPASAPSPASAPVPPAPLGHGPSPAPAPVPTHAPPKEPMMPAPAAPCNEIRMRTEAEKQWNHTGFKTVKVLGPIEVIIEQGPFAVNAQGDEGAMESLMVTMEGGKLVITGGGSKNNGKSAERGSGRGNEKSKHEQTCGSSAVVHITIPDLERVELLGPGDIHISEFTNLTSMELDLQGSGDIHFVSFKGLNKLAIALAGSGDIFGEEAEVTGTTRIALTGSGDVLIAGRTDKVDISVIGSGDVEASDLVANGGEVHVTGSGDVILNSKGTTVSQVMGSGEVHNIGSSGSGSRID